jgi:hypothetical protein
MEMDEKMIITDMPASHPSCAIAHARAKTPAPTTTVIMCVVAVTTFPAYPIIFIKYHQIYHSSLGVINLVVNGCFIYSMNLCTLFFTLS